MTSGSEFKERFVIRIVKQRRPWACEFSAMRNRGQMIKNHINIADGKGKDRRVEQKDLFVFGENRLAQEKSDFARPNGFKYLERSSV